MTGCKFFFPIATVLYYDGLGCSLLMALIFNWLFTVCCWEAPHGGGGTLFASILAAFEEKTGIVPTPVVKTSGPGDDMPKDETYAAMCARTGQTASELGKWTWESGFGRPEPEDAGGEEIVLAVVQT